MWRRASRIPRSSPGCCSTHIACPVLLAVSCREGWLRERAQPRVRLRLMLWTAAQGGACPHQYPRSLGRSPRRFKKNRGPEETRTRSSRNLLPRRRHRPLPMRSFRVLLLPRFFLNRHRSTRQAPGVLLWAGAVCGGCPQHQPKAYPGPSPGPAVRLPCLPARGDRPTTKLRPSSSAREATKRWSNDGVADSLTH